jgi:DNA polymerase-3 subunit delta
MKDVLTQVDGLLEKGRKDGFDGVWLIFGDELLVEKACKKVLDAIVKKEKQSLNCQFMDAENHGIGIVLENLNTYGLFPEAKVVVWHNDKLLASVVNAEDFLEKAVGALEENKREKARGFLLTFMGMKKLSFENLDPENLEEYLGDFSSELKPLVAELKAKGVRVPPYVDDSKLLMQAMDKGFAPENHLVVTTVVADKRKRLYKHIESNGAVVDCTVKSGQSAADKRGLEESAAQIVSQFEKAWSKKVDSKAVTALLELLGADFRALESNLAKLGVYVGERPAITARDVQSIVSRTRKDPVYLLTDALTSRKPDKALVFLDFLFDDGFHELAVAAATINQFRRLVVIKSFLEGPGKGVYAPGMRYDDFQKRLGNAPAAFDAQLNETLLQWSQAWSQEEDEEETGEQDDADETEKQEIPAQKVKAKKPVADIGISKMNSYVLYLACGKAQNFSMNQLNKALWLLRDADKAIKSTGQNPRLLTETLVLSLCSL